jgi:hypothetical protein
MEERRGPPGDEMSTYHLHETRTRTSLRCSKPRRAMHHEKPKVPSAKAGMADCSDRASLLRRRLPISALTTCRRSTRCPPVGSTYAICIGALEREARSIYKLRASRADAQPSKALGRGWKGGTGRAGTGAGQTAGQRSTIQGESSRPTVEWPGWDECRRLETRARQQHRVPSTEPPSTERSVSAPYGKRDSACRCNRPGRPIGSRLRRTGPMRTDHSLTWRTHLAPQPR